MLVRFDFTQLQMHIGWDIIALLAFPSLRVVVSHMTKLFHESSMLVDWIVVVLPPSDYISIE